MAWSGIPMLVQPSSMLAQRPARAKDMEPSPPLPYPLRGPISSPGCCGQQGISQLDGVNVPPIKPAANSAPEGRNRILATGLQNWSHAIFYGA